MDNTLTPEQKITVDRLTHDFARGNQAMELLRIGYRMRQAQVKYFKDRSRENLIASKELEKAFDAGLEELKKTKD